MTNFKRVTEDNKMSEKEKTIETKEEKTKINDVVGDNVALLKSRIISLEALVEELTSKLDAINDKYAQAKEFIDDDAKAELMAYISPRYDMPKELLVLKTVDELKAIKAVIDKVEIPAFKAGTKMTSPKKMNQRAMLDSTFERKQAARMEGKN